MEISLDIYGSVAFAFVLGKIFEGPTKAITKKLANKFPGIRLWKGWLVHIAIQQILHGK